MIPTESLAVGPAMRWLALALSSAFVFSVFVITAGDAIFRRLQRRALQRSLNKVEWHKLVAAILLSFSLLTSQMAFGQTAPAPTSSAVRYQKLFTLVSGIMKEVPKVCKTEACIKAAEEGAALIADAQEKHSKGLLVDEVRTQFHANLQTNLTALRMALLATLPEEKQKEIAARCPACKTAQVKPVQSSDECQLCEDVLEVTAEICALYLGTCNTCALICLSTAALAYGHCLRDYCQPQNPPPDNTN
jgi:hypothetical protein